MSIAEFRRWGRKTIYKIKTTIGMEAKSKCGDWVKLVSKDYGDSNTNPHWGSNNGHIPGILLQESGPNKSGTILWQNGHKNNYNAGAYKTLTADEYKKYVASKRFMLMLVINGSVFYEAYRSLPDVKVRIGELVMDVNNGRAICVYEVSGIRKVAYKTDIALE